MNRILIFAVGLTIVIASGVVYGSWTQRWQESAALESAIAKLQGLPEEVGRWKAQPADLDRDALDMAGAKGWWIRRFTDERTGTSLLVILMCGRAGPLCVHKPETCYTGAGYALTTEPIHYRVRSENEATAAEFWTGVFKKPEVGGEQLRIFWSWYDGGAWRVTDNPRWTFAHLPALYKLYVIHETEGRLERLEDDPAAEFLRRLLPVTSRTLSAP